MSIFDFVNKNIQNVNDCYHNLIIFDRNIIRKMHFSDAPYKKNNYLNPCFSANEGSLDNCYAGLQSAPLINNLVSSDETFSIALGCYSSSLLESRLTSGMTQVNDSVDKLFKSYYTSDGLNGPRSAFLPDSIYSVADLVDKGSAKLPDFLFPNDNVLIHSIAIGAEHILKVPNSFKEFKKSVKRIDQNKVYNTDILFNDLNDLVKHEGSSNIFRKIGKLLGFTDQTNIDYLFDKIGNLSPVEIIELDDEIWTITDVTSFIELRNDIEYHIKLKVLARYIKAEIQKIIEHEQSRISLVTPIILHLREYLDNIFNIKRIYFGTLIDQFRDINILNIFINGFKRQNRVIMLALESKGERAFL